MTDPSAAWLSSMIRAGETAVALRAAGHTWPQISDELHLGDVRTAQRAAALFLASDYQSRRTAGDGTGDAQPQAGANGSPAPERTADGIA